jgi:uncharacterized protein (DUF433 family)
MGGILSLPGGKIMSTTSSTHILLDDRGRAWIAETNVKVIEVVLDKLAHGSSPEEMHFQYPHLSLAQIHAALTYYYDHQAELDVEIARQFADLAAITAAAEETPLRRRLKQSGRIP